MPAWFYILRLKSGGLYVGQPRIWTSDTEIIVPVKHVEPLHSIALLLSFIPKKLKLFPPLASAKRK